MAMNSYFSTSHGKPGIVAAFSSATSWIRTYQEPGISRILDHQDDARPLLSTTFKKGPGFNPPAVTEDTAARPNPHIVILYR
jgi:hypothetical protein